MDSLKNNQLLGRYRVVAPNEVKYGGIGKVYKCIDNFDQLVALKTIPLNSPIRQLTFKRETTALKRLDHSGIVPILDFEVSEEVGYIVMPWYENSLHDLISSNRLPQRRVERLLSIVTPLADALTFAHQNEVYHRDIKARNVLINEKGYPVLADFGSAKILAHEEKSETVLRFESQHYTPQNSGTLAQHDIYSWAIVSIEIIMGRLTTSFEDAADLLSSGLKNQDISAETGLLLSKSMERDPRRRHKTMFEVKSSLEARAKRLNKKSQTSTHLAWIKLTNKARSELRPLAGSSRTLDEVITEKLNEQQIYAFPEGKNFKDRFWLISDDFKILLRPNDEQDGWVAIEASLLGDNDIEHQRSKSFLLNDLLLNWEAAENCRFQKQGLQATFTLVNLALLNWNRRGTTSHFDSNFAEHELEKMLNLWERITDAKEEIEEQKYSPLEYMSIESVNSEVQIKLSEAFDGDLEGTSWEVPFEKPTTGQVTFHSANELIISFGRDPIGKPKNKGTIKPSLDYGTEVQLERQREAVRAVREKRTANTRLGSYLLNPETAPKYNPIEPMVWCQEELDQSKKEAVSLALGSSNFALIKGPPGTGKTSFISEYIYQEIRKNPNVKILLVSQTHVALDNAIERVGKLGIENIVRIGKDDRRVSTKSKKYLIENQMFAWRKRLEKRSKSNAEIFANSQGLTVAESSTLIVLNKLIAVMNEIDNLRQLEKEREDSRESQILDGIVGTNTEVASRRIEQLTKERQDLTSELRNTSLSVGLTLPKEVDSETCLHLRDAITGNRNLSAQFLSMIETQSKWINKIGTSTQIEPLYLKTCNVIAGTCEGFMSNSSVREINFDVCIIDEASKASTLQALVPLSRSMRFVIVGDSHQLSSSEYELKDPENADVLKKNELIPSDIEETMFSRLEKRLPVSHIRTLNTQYRMRNPIGQMISDCFYDGEIRSQGPSTLYGIERFLPAVIWHDTGEADNVNEHRVGTSYSNRSEILTIVDYLKTIANAIERNLIKIPENKKISVLVVCAYAAQVTLARAIIRDIPSKYVDIEFNTIDAVQGREADLVFFSPVRNNKVFSLGFLNSNNWRRINVALSRGRISVIIIGSAAFWSSKSSGLNKVLTYVENRNDDINFQLKAPND